MGRSDGGCIRRCAMACIVQTLLTCGCTVGPDFVSPETPKTTSFTEKSLPLHTSNTPGMGGESQSFRASEAVPERWWTLYGSKELDALVDRALHNNPTVAAAQAALHAAQEQVSAQQGGLYPSVSGNFGATRQKVSGASAGYPQAGSFLYTLYNASVTLGYNFDVFGGVRRGVEAEEAARDEKAYELEAAYQTLAANVVTSAVREASLNAQIKTTRESLVLAQHEVDLNRTRFELGGATRANVLSAESNQASLEATLPPLERGLAVARAQLAVYLGTLPSEYHQASFDLEALRLPQAIPLSLPSTLVRQRPDIREAEAQLHEACANVGVATSNLLPQINLSATIGGASNTIASLLTNGVFSTAATLTQPLFQGGVLTARRRAAIAEYDRARAQYQQTVLQAFENVSDALEAVVSDADTLNAEFHSQSTAMQSLQMTQKQYELGGATSLDLLIAQLQYQKARIDYVQTIGTRYQDTAALFLALGGNWSTGAKTP
jgi:NodT family efflux transporter outer membrane factor (OMF) lipoprotein